MKQQLKMLDIRPKKDSDPGLESFQAAVLGGSQVGLNQHPELRR